MEKFITHTGIGVPLKRSNVDTDQIIPAHFLKSVSRTGFEDALFSNWRNNEPDFVLNRKEFAGGSVLFTGPDFGTGSSREHAVWALNDYGFRAVFSPRFADIFRGNSGKAGLLAGVMSEADIELVWKQLEQNPGLEVTVSLVDRTVTVGENTFTFDVDDYVRYRLMEGLDDIGITLREAPSIENFEKTRPAYKPRV
ncbi:3-isopropylmalate dehydratase small subunit [Corynebacterium mayonis]|uniref:3-isopropylmalate dehydratase small subunit n=1 Tax=Corynebacterium mayonis TaxID=3062461 RepID=UPI00313FFDCF